MKRGNRKMKKELILGGISILMLLFMALPVTSACIDITGIGTRYDGIDHYGCVDYQNIANVNASGAILVFIDGDIVAGKIIDMPIRYIAGVRCSLSKMLEFPLRMSKGNHTIVAYALSQNITTQCVYGYTMEGWEDMPPDEETDEEEMELNEEWLFCWEE